LLHLYNNAVTAHTASVNSLKGYLNQFASTIPPNSSPTPVSIQEDERAGGAKA
jgi:hypothetical protein